MDPVLTVAGVTKSWPGQRRPAVSDVSFRVHAGEVVGLVGPNGAGKSTTLGIVSTRVRPDAGRVSVGGHDTVAAPHRARNQLAVVPQRANLDRSLTARQVLTFHGAYFGMSRQARADRAEELLTAMSLGERAGDRTDTFSGGMAQRLLLARALMHDPLLLALDEPTTGLDPTARRYLRDTIRGLAGRGVGVLLCSHDIAEVETLCDRVAILHHGEVLAFDAVADLRHKVPGGALVQIGLAEAVPPENAGATVRVLRELPGVERVDAVKGALPGVSTIRLVCGQQPERVLGAAVAALAAAGTPVASVRVAEPSLEDIFFQLTGEGLS